MMPPTGLTRQETIALTGITSGRLSYLDKSKLVVPSKGKGDHPQVVYTWEQMVQIKIIERLRDKLPLQKIRRVVNAIKGRQFTTLPLEGNLMVLGESLHVITSAMQFQTIVLALAAKHQGKVQVFDLGSPTGLLAEVQANREKVLDFDKRVEGTLLAPSLEVRHG